MYAFILPARTHARTAIIVGAVLAIAATMAATLTTPPAAAAAAPAPCRDVAQVSDVTGDGHHAGTDLAGAWFSEANGTLQAVVRVSAGLWAPEHDDEEVNGSAYAMLFTHAGAVRYVRVSSSASAALTYDYGTFTPAGGFATQGSTTGEVVAATNGTATISVPAAMGVVAGSTLTNVFALTFDGSTGGVPHWVDRAPGGTTTTEASFGADYVVGSCTTTADPSVGTTAVELNVPTARFGAGNVRVSGRIVPAREGVHVAIRRVSAGVTRTMHATTRADGTYVRVVTIGADTTIRATADGISSQQASIRVQAIVKVRAWRDRAGHVVVSGTTSPALPGQVLLLGEASVDASATRTIRGGTFRIVAGRLPADGYQVVYIPARDRAERAVSNVVRIQALR